MGVDTTNKILISGAGLDAFTSNKDEVACVLKRGTERVNLPVTELLYRGSFHQIVTDAVSISTPGSFNVRY